MYSWINTHAFNFLKIAIYILETAFSSSTEEYKQDNPSLKYITIFSSNVPLTLWLSKLYLYRKNSFPSTEKSFDPQLEASFA